MNQAVGGLRPTVRAQWAQLIVLSGVHFLVDMFGNVLPAILPVICRDFRVTLAVGGGLVLASVPLASNGVQILTGHLRPDKTKPLFLYLGVALSASICLIALAPQSLAGIALIIGLGVISGAGVAVTHPEGLRAIHALDRIAPALSTAIFMTAGFLGFASGGAISAALVASYGLKGLYPLIPTLAVAIVAMLLARVRLAVEHAEANPDSRSISSSDHILPFWKVLCLGLPAAVSTTVILQLTPTYLHERGFTLAFGGVSAAMFGWGSTVGPFIWTAIAHRKGDLASCVWAFLLSSPFIVLYLIFSQHAAAAWLLFGVGFSAMSAYILTIALARQSRGANLGRRMALIVGGTWGIATIAFMLLAPVADRVGTGLVLKLTPAGYVLSGLWAFYVLRQHPQAARVRPPVETGGLPGEEPSTAL
ncbi:MAG: MFS transporter [Planctomycetes bacterium]|nr:MFS transporter [Planctomycetota bacterium]